MNSTYDRCSAGLKVCSAYPKKRQFPSHYDQRCASPVITPPLISTEPVQPADTIIHLSSKIEIECTGGPRARLARDGVRETIHNTRLSPNHPTILQSILELGPNASTELPRHPSIDVVKAINLRIHCIGCIVSVGEVCCP